MQTVLLLEVIFDVAASEERIHILSIAATAVSGPLRVGKPSLRLVSVGILEGAVVGGHAHLLKRILLTLIQRLRVAPIRAVVLKPLNLSG